MSVRSFRRKKHRGVGDSLESVLKLSGVHFAVKLAERATGKKCGCEKRRDALNLKFPYKK